MRYAFYIFVISLTFFAESCAQKHKDVQTPNLAGSKTANDIQKAQTDAGVKTSDLVDITKLTAPKVTLTAQNICTKDSSSDQALQITVANDQPFDVFDVKACDDAVQNCSPTQSFLDTHYLLNPPSSSVAYTKVLFRACVDAFHSVDGEKSCTDWQTQDFAFQSLSPQTTKLLARQQTIRTQMEGICKDLRDEMTTFVNAPMATNGSTKNLADLKSLVQNTLNNVSDSTCVEMLISNQLAILDNVASLMGSVTNSQSSTGGSNLKNIKVQSETTGLMFIIAGGAGIILSGWGMVGTIRNTKSEGYVSLLGQIATLKKEIQFLEIQNLNQQINFLEDFVSKLEKAGAAGGSISSAFGEMDREVKEGIDAAIVGIQNEYLAEPKEGEGEDAAKERKERIKALKSLGEELQAQSNFNKDDLIRRLQEIIPLVERPGKVWGTSKVQVDVAGNIGRLDSYMSQFSDWLFSWVRANPGPTPEQELYFALQKKRQVVQVQQIFYEYRGNREEFPKYAEVHPGDSDKATLAEIKAHIADLKAQKTALEGTWAERGWRLIGAAASGTTEGALKGLFYGVAMGGVYEATVGRIAGGGPGMGHVAAGGAAIGGAVGGMKGIYDEWVRQQAPEFRGNDRVVHDLPVIEGGTKQRQELIDTKKTNIKVLGPVWHEDFTPSALFAKGRAAIPWVIALGVSSATTYVGAQQMGLADVLTPQDEFLQNFSATYSQVGPLQREYTSNLIELYAGTCGK